MTNGNPYDKAHDLARAIKDTEAFRRYVAVQKQLGQNPGALERVRDFRNLQMEVNQAHSLGQEPAEGRVDYIAIQYAKLNKDDLIAEYFQAEGLFVQMYNDVQDIIQKSLDNGFDE
jgi:cell fate (sporulation/competence/biofilm development) regulator YlbF (YheA/YmcA/DUF963 family)